MADKKASFKEMIQSYSEIFTDISEKLEIGEEPPNENNELTKEILEKLDDVMTALFALYGCQEYVRTE